MRTTVGVLLAVAVMALSGCGSSTETSGGDESPSPEIERIETTVGVLAFDVVAMGAKALGDEPEDRCNRWGGDYRDLKTGASTVVRNDADRIVGKGTLGDSVWLPGLPACLWTADVEIEAGGGFYYAEVLDWEGAPVAEDDLDDEEITVEIAFP